MKQLVEFFEFCEACGMELHRLQTAANLHKYREAAAHLHDMINGKEPDLAMMAELIQITDRIKEESRDEVRDWVRRPRYA